MSIKSKKETKFGDYLNRLILNIIREWRLWK
jgi:hypothetical protein